MSEIGITKLPVIQTREVLPLTESVDPNLVPVLEPTCQECKYGPTIVRYLMGVFPIESKTCKVCNVTVFRPVKE